MKKHRSKVVLELYLFSRQIVNDIVFGGTNLDWTRKELLDRLCIASIAVILGYFLLVIILSSST